LFFLLTRNHYSDCHNYVPIGAGLNYLGMGAHVNRRKFVSGLQCAHKLDSNIDVFHIILVSYSLRMDAK